MSLFEDTGEHIQTVGELIESLQDAVEVAFPRVVVTGEVSRPVRPASGHLYLTLKDPRNVLPVVMWRSAASKLRFEVEEGMQVTAWGSLTVYGPQGKYQFVATRLKSDSSVGALAAAFEKLKAALEAEGLFDVARKKELPFRPRRVALVTSSSGAVVHDLLDTILARCPRIEVIVVPVRVQGKGAAGEIATALRRCNADSLADVIVVGRGGGSLEDLWAFNEEAVARAVADSEIPVVSAVGHETDFTICDMVADLEAKTPTEAGFVVVPDLVEELGMLEAQRRNLVRGMRRPVQRYRDRLQGYSRSAALASPRQQVILRRQRVGDLLLRMQGTLPDLKSLRARSLQVIMRSRHTLRSSLVHHRDAAKRAAAHLYAVSPRAVLERGYSITLKGDGTVLKSAADSREGDELTTQFAEDALVSRVLRLAGEEAGLGRNDLD